MKPLGRVFEGSCEALPKPFGELPGCSPARRTVKSPSEIQPHERAVFPVSMRVENGDRREGFPGAGKWRRGMKLHPASKRESQGAWWALIHRSREPDIASRATAHSGCWHAFRRASALWLTVEDFGGLQLEKARFLQSGGRPTVPHIPHNAPEGEVGKPEGLSGSQTEETSPTHNIASRNGDVQNKPNPLRGFCWMQV